MKFLQKAIPIIFIIFFTIILSLLFIFSGIEYHLKRNLIINNILILIFIIIPIFLIYYFLVRKSGDISNKKYKTILIVIALIIFIIQIILVKCIYFYTDWDVKVIRDIVNEFFKNGNLKNNYYLTIYPNNLFLTMIIVAIKSIPIVGNNYLFLLGINCLLVDLAGVFTSLTIKNISNNKKALLSFAIMIPLILLSPWIVIPYTDTFAILFPILVLYLYTKKQKKLIDYYLIGLCTFVGYYIKPTVIIIFMSIVIVEIFSKLKILFNKEKIKRQLKIACIIIFGIFTALVSNKSASYILKFEPLSYAKPFSFIHYLAMGQNNKTLGAYSQTDINYSIEKGKTADLKKFYKRITNRTFSEQIAFFSKKTLLNFNDGSFSWGLDGIFFYEINKTNSSFAKFLREIYYDGGKYFLNFLQVCQILWLLVLSFCPFIAKKKNNKNELVIMLAIIGITLFLTIFEPRTRYLYCYSPIFIVCFVLGFSNLKNTIKNKFDNKETQGLRLKSK